MDHTLPVLHLNFLHILVAVVISFLFGWIYYGPLFGKPWAKLMGFKDAPRPGAGAFIRMMIINLVGTFLVTYVLFHSVEVWRPSNWGILGKDMAAYKYGFFAGFFTWVGFFIPMLFNTVTWEGRPWKLFFLNAAYHFVNLQIIAQILANWR